MKIIFALIGLLTLAACGGTFGGVSNDVHNMTHDSQHQVRTN